MFDVLVIWWLVDNCQLIHVKVNDLAFIRRFHNVILNVTGHDEALLEELTNFIYDDQGRIKHQVLEGPIENFKFDLIITSGIF